MHVFFTCSCHVSALVARIRNWRQLKEPISFTKLDVYYTHHIVINSFICTVFLLKRLEQQSHSGATFMWPAVLCIFYVHWTTVRVFVVCPECIIPLEIHNWRINDYLPVSWYSSIFYTVFVRFTPTHKLNSAIAWQELHKRSILYALQQCDSILYAMYSFRKSDDWYHKAFHLRFTAI